jgi:4,5-DOPA dioxygenase extradiol
MLSASLKNPQSMPQCCNRAMQTTLPTIFVSHGSPMVALEPGAAGAFMQRLGPAIDAAFGRPTAIVVISAHTAARVPVVLAGPHHEAVYDFGNFDSRLNAMRYDAAGSNEVATRVASGLEKANIPVQRLAEGGLDHGIWTALRYIYPKADVPVVPLAFVPNQSPAQQFALGAALAPLRHEGVLVLGTGSMTHNLRRALGGGLHADLVQPEIPESAAFREWFRARSAVQDWDALFDYRRRAPHAQDMHPTDEHLMPWFVAAGAGGRSHAPVRLHDSVTLGSLGMDAYAFGASAPDLLEYMDSAPLGVAA